MKVRLFMIGCLIFTLSLVDGQPVQKPGSAGDILEHLKQDGAEDQVTIVLDSLLEANYYKFMAMNQKESGIPGYRIRIFSESGLGAKEEQQKVRARFLSLHPEIDAYYRYDEPFFKVYVGDCRTKSEVIKLMEAVKKNFPNSIWVPDYINLKSSE